MLIRVRAGPNARAVPQGQSKYDVDKENEGWGGGMLCPGIMKDRSVSHVLKWTCQLKGYYPCGHFINLIEKVGGNRDSVFVGP